MAQTCESIRGGFLEVRRLSRVLRDEEELARSTR